ncbi:HpcH/HpaI aldolase/citrate lyase family protein [Chloroflexota bacterium]
MPVMRSVMYVPGNKEDMIAKIPSMPADVITLDIEDSVPPAEKQRARELSHQNLKLAASGGAEVYVRINNWETGMTNADCEAVVDEGLAAVCLAKCSGPDDVKRLDWKLEEMEQKRGLGAGSVQIQLLIETAKGMMNIFEAAVASKRVNSLIFGAVDYTTDMRIKLNQPLGKELEWPRARLACAARATGLLAIDCPYLAFRDIEGFEADTTYGSELGFEGRMLIHPNQIEPSHKIYSPEPARVEWAKGVVKVFEEEGIAKGSAAVTYEGKMVDTPVYIGAKGIIETMAEIEAKEKKRSGK